MPQVMLWGLMLMYLGSKLRLLPSGVCSTGSHSATARLRYRCGLWLQVWLPLLYLMVSLMPLDA